MNALYYAGVTLEGFEAGALDFFFLQSRHCFIVLGSGKIVTTSTAGVSERSEWGLRGQT